MTPYTCPIDPHVHLRGQEYQQEFLRLGLVHARAAGLCCVMEQPNPVPQLINHDAIERRNFQVMGILKDESIRVEHHCHIGLTTSPGQVEMAMRTAQARAFGVHAVKTFWVHSTGDMGLLDPEYQKKVWQIAARVGYTGPVIQHCEDEKEFAGEFDPAEPISHTFRQSAVAEYAQVERQLRNAYDAGFAGTFYIAHVTNPNVVDLVEAFQRLYTDAKMKIVMEACWHHLLLNTDDYEIHGNNVKMNPPLRPPPLQERLLKYLLEGRIQIVATDHAPHAPKDPVKPASGIPGIPFWPKGIEILRRHGISEPLLHDLTFANAKAVFGLDCESLLTKREYNPELWQPYSFNPFARIDGTL
jgi:dihydroorotase